VTKIRRREIPDVRYGHLVIIGGFLDPAVHEEHWTAHVISTLSPGKVEDGTADFGPVEQAHVARVGVDRVVFLVIAHSSATGDLGEADQVLVAVGVKSIAESVGCDAASAFKPLELQVRTLFRKVDHETVLRTGAWSERLELTAYVFVDGPVLLLTFV